MTGMGGDSVTGGVPAQASTATVERERPEICNIEDFWCWVNTWGDERKYQLEGSQFNVGYRRCISDTLKALETAGVTFETVSDEAWSRWTGMRA